MKYEIELPDNYSEFIELLSDLEERTVSDFLQRLILRHVKQQAEWGIRLAERLREEGAITPQEPTFRRVPLRNEVRAFVFEKHDGKCAYCSVVLSPFGKWHVDHKHPVSRGGTDDLENLALACVPCNLAKGDKTVEEFKRRYFAVVDGQDAA